MTEKINMKVAPNEEEKITDQLLRDNPKVERLLHTANDVNKVPPLKLNNTSSELSTSECDNQLDDFQSSMKDISSSKFEADI